MNATPTATAPDHTTIATLLVDELVAALVNTRIYLANHPRVETSLTAALRRLGELVDLTQDPVCIAGIDGLVVFQQRPLLGASMSAARLLGALQLWGAGGLELRRATTLSELGELLAGLATRPRPGQDLAALNAQLVERQCRNVRLLPPYVDALGLLQKTTSTNIRVGVHFYQSIVDLLQTVTVSVCRGGQIDFGPVQGQAEQMLRQLEENDTALLSLARQDQYDAFTFGHSVRVAILSLNFARTLTDDRELLIRIGTAALLHDVGKSLIPFELLHSTGTLDAEQRRAMNRHSDLGAECLLDHHDSDPLAIAAAFAHHRSPDGSGYPRTLHEHETTMVTSIVKICDIYEALTAARPYKQPMSPIRAYRVMLAMGDKLDRRLLKQFVQGNGIHPAGQFVELDDGEVAVVRRQNADPLQPVVALVDRPDAMVTVEEEQLLDLSQIECCGARAILRDLTPQEVEQRLADRPPRTRREPPPSAPPHPPKPEPPPTQPAQKQIVNPFRWD